MSNLSSQQEIESRIEAKTTKIEENKVESAKPDKNATITSSCFESNKTQFGELMVLKETQKESNSRFVLKRGNDSTILNSQLLPPLKKSSLVLNYKDIVDEADENDSVAGWFIR